MTAMPRVSVIIPAYYSYDTIKVCLLALRSQTFSDFEVILINSSPEDMTRRIVESQFPEVIFIQSPIRLLPHAARNHGVRVARGELFVFTDPDCRARPDWLTRLVETHDAGHSVVGGGMELLSKRWFEQGVHICKFSWALNGLSAGPHWILPSSNVCYSRRVWEKIGPFEETRFCGDALLSWCTREAGFIPWFEPRAVVEHQHQESVSSFWRQRLVRGHEFAESRMAFERWSRSKASTYFFLMPLLVIVVLAKAGRDAFKSGWGPIFFLTLPLQAVGQLAWCLGESRAHWQLALWGTARGRHNH